MASGPYGSLLGFNGGYLGGQPTGLTVPSLEQLLFNAFNKACVTLEGKEIILKHKKKLEEISM